ncbi:hypothetical protein TRAPUB_13581 [Trametes pubescens]|uniref:Uncharacterized protein n=1 Tax=Trametes pubescens TaxID=154538 RepID=A0A1M2VQQ7_TRAPU|nr:hypothetical protein TRAPUB_13581 [Trametes pubescens]
MYKSLKWTPEREQALQRRTRAKLQARRPRQKKSEHVNSRTEARMQYREKKGLPGHVDLWLATKLAQSITDDIESPVTPDEVQCSVHVCRIPNPEPDEYFVDLDTFVLHLTVRSAPRSFQEGALESERRVVLGQYTGDPADWDAPDWTLLPADKAVVFRENATAVANLIQHTGPCADQTKALADSLAAVRLDG